MSTDHNPWTALVDALREIRDNRGTSVRCNYCGAADDYHAVGCPADVARSALASWESRPRLREDGAMVDEVIRWEYARNAGAVDGTIGDLLDAIEARLLGAPGKGTT